MTNPAVHAAVRVHGMIEVSLLSRSEDDLETPLNIAPQTASPVHPQPAVDGRVAQVAAVYVQGRRTHRQVVSRGQALLRNVLNTRADLAAEREVPELIIDRITTLSACCLPADFEVYRVTEQGTLRNVLTFPKDDREVGPGESWGLLNHFDFLEANRLQVRRILPVSDLIYDFEYLEGAGRYQPTRETASRLRAEAAARRAELE